MNNQIIEVITESGVEKSTALTLQDSFMPFFQQAEEWKNKAKELKVTDVSQTREMKMAREARLALKEIRVNADKKRKELKEDSLRYGKAVQGVYNVIEYLIVPIEKHLEEQEKFAEIQESKRKDELKEARQKELEPYQEFIPFVDLREMSEEDYNKLLSGAKLQLEQKLESERKIEQERIAKEKAEAEERARIEAENKKLKQEAEERERKEQAEAKLRAEQEAKRLEAEKREREAYEAKIKAEQEAKAKLEAELKAKQEAEAKVQRQKELAEKKAKLAPDKDKLIALAENLLSIQMPAVENEEALKVLQSTQELLLKTSNYIKQQAEKL